MSLTSVEPLLISVSLYFQETLAWGMACTDRISSTINSIHEKKPLEQNACILHTSIEQTSDMFLPSMTSRYMDVGETLGMHANSEGERVLMASLMSLGGLWHRGSTEFGTVKFCNQACNASRWQSQCHLFWWRVKSLKLWNLHLNANHRWCTVLNKYQFGNWPHLQLFVYVYFLKCQADKWDGPRQLLDVHPAFGMHLILWNPRFGRLAINVPQVGWETLCRWKRSESVGLQPQIFETIEATKSKSMHICEAATT